MARQTSKNRWVNGKKKLSFYPHYSEFAGGYECGTAIPIGRFRVTMPNAEPESLEVFSGSDRDSVIRTFLETGEIHEAVLWGP
jgi:hypothetical protein